MAQIELLLLLLLSAVALGWIARHFQFPYPIALVAGGVALGLVPNLPQHTFDPQLVLVMVLPPILYQAPLLTSWTDFKAHLRPIGLLAIGLVAATTLAVAATAILSRLSIPRRIVTILEGESLVNDASGLVLYKFAVVTHLRLAVIAAERAELIHLWRDNRIGDEVMHHLMETLDYEQAHLPKPGAPAAHDETEAAPLATK